MKVYRIKHIETGLYYRPCVGVGKFKTNLGLKGKVYLTKPTNKHCVFENNYLINVSEIQIKKYNYLKNKATFNGCYYIKANEECNKPQIIEIKS